MDAVKFKRLKGMMVDYQEDFEKDKSHPFVQAFNECDNNTTTVLAGLEAAIHEQVYAALNLGFAMDVMDLSGSGKNRELLEEFLRMMRGEEESKCK